MARYKVPQDVEADDKLLGPFSFRQFVYLLVAAGLGFVAFLLFQIFPLLVIIPIPIILFLILLALPLKKDQPMETYLSALADFYLKPHKRIWMPGQSATTITVTAPKNIEENRTKDISREEAGRRLSFLADIVDTEGYAIKNAPNANLRDDIADEASMVVDMLDNSQNASLNRNLAQSEDNRRAQLLEQMQTAINTANAAAPAPQTQPVAPVDISSSSATVQPDMEEIHEALMKPEQSEDSEQAIIEDIAETYAPKGSDDSDDTAPAQPTEGDDFEVVVPEPQVMSDSKPTELSESSSVLSEALKSIESSDGSEEPEAPPDNQNLADLANNSDYSVETIAHEANRVQNQSNEDETYISLH